MKKLTWIITISTLLFSSTPSGAQIVSGSPVPPPNLHVEKLDGYNPGENHYKPRHTSTPDKRKYKHLINKAPGDESSEGYEYERYSRNYDSADCGLKVNVNPFKLLNEDFNGLVSWSSRKCPDEEKLETIRQNGQTRRTEINRDRDIAVTTIKGNKQVAATTVEQCLSARTQALNVGYDPE